MTRGDVVLTFGGGIWGSASWGGTGYGATTSCMFLLLTRNVLRGILSLFMVIGKVRWGKKWYIFDILMSDLDLDYVHFHARGMLPFGYF